jgi:hypothetical protein
VRNERLFFENYTDSRSIYLDKFSIRDQAVLTDEIPKKFELDTTLKKKPYLTITSTVWLQILDFGLARTASDGALTGYVATRYPHHFILFSEP